MFSLNNFAFCLWGGFLVLLHSLGCLVLYFMTEDTKNEVQRLLGKIAPQTANKIRPGRMPLWAIVQCNDDAPLDADGSIREQLFPGTIIRTDTKQIYPETDDAVADLYGSPVLMTILSGTDAEPETPVFVVPRKGALYVGVLLSEVEEDRTTEVIESQSQTVMGRTRFVGVEYASQAATQKVTKVRAATVAAGTISTSFEDGDSVDGVTLQTGDRVLIKNQSTASENGVYIVNSSGSPARASDYDSGDEVSGAIVSVTEGTHNGDTVWICTSNHTAATPLTVGTDAINWLLVGPVKTGANASSGPVTVASSDTWFTAVSVSLPGPGTYLINAAVNAAAAVSAGGQGYIYFRLWNSTGSVAVSESFVSTIPQGPAVDQTYCFFSIVTVTVASTISAQALRSSALATWVYTGLNNSGVTARSSINYSRFG